MKAYKKLGFALCLLLGLSILVCAQAADVPQAAMALIEKTYPDYTVLDSLNIGEDVLTILSLGDPIAPVGASNVLCIARRNEAGDYAFIVRNEHIFSPNATDFSCTLGPDGASVFIRCKPFGESSTLHFTREADGRYSDVDSLLVTSSSCEKITLCAKDGALQCTYEDSDNEGNLLRRYEFPPIPIPDLGGRLTLENANEALLTGGRYMLLPLERGQLIADSLLSNRCTVVDTCVVTNAFALMADGVDGARRLYIFEYQNGAYQITKSAPVQQKASFDSFHSFDSILVHLDADNLQVSIMKAASSVWCITNIMGDECFSIGDHYIDALKPVTEDGASKYYGEHPWHDIRDMDFFTVPKTVKQALQALDQSQYAVVNNPNPADRLHLRVLADKSAASLGKFYNGAPVRILSKGREYTRVQLGNLTGYMMTKYLAFGANMQQVTPALPELFLREELSETGIFIYEQANERARVLGCIKTPVSGSEIEILGVANEDFYYVTFSGEGLQGYVRQDCFCPGNG